MLGLGLKSFVAQAGSAIVAVTPNAGSANGGYVTKFQYSPIPASVTKITIAGRDCTALSYNAGTGVATATTPAWGSANGTDVGQTIASETSLGTVIGSTIPTTYFYYPTNFPIVAHHRTDVGITIATGVSVWADQSGNAANWTQASGPAQPGTATDYNGTTLPQLTLNGSQTMAAPVSLTSTKAAIFCVMNVTSQGSAPVLGIPVELVPATGNLFRLGSPGVGFDAWFVSDGVVNLTSDVLPVDSLVHVFYGVADGATSVVALDWFETDGALSGPTGTIVSMTLGGNAGFNVFGGFGEDLIYDGNPDLADRMTIQSIMAQNWQTSQAPPVTGLPRGHFIGTGQSLGNGSASTAPLSNTAMAATDVKLFDSANVYSITDQFASTLRIVPATAPQRTPGTTEYPTNIGTLGESMEIQAARQYRTMALARGASSCSIACTCVAIGGSLLSEISEGGSGNAFAASIYELKAHSLRAGGPFSVTSVPLTNGEADGQAYSLAGNMTPADFLSGLEGLQTSYQTQCSLVTGQSAVIPVAMTLSNTTPPNYGGPIVVAEAMVQAAQTIPTLFVLAGPKYQDDYQTGGPHLLDYRARANVLGKYIFRWAEHYGFVQDGSGGFFPADASVDFSPMWATAAVRVGTVVTVTLHVPVLPIVIDTTNFPQLHTSGALALWADGMGFEYFDRVVNATGASTATPVVVECDTSDYTTGMQVIAEGFGGLIGADINGPWTCTVIDGGHLQLDGSTTTNAYTAGGRVFTPVGITSIAPSGSTIVVNLASVPVGTAFLAYGNHTDQTYAESNPFVFGPPYGGNIRDSDPFEGVSAADPDPPSPQERYFTNWLCNFALQVT